MLLNPRNLILIFLPIVVVTAVDQSLQRYILSQTLPLDGGWVQIVATANRGIIGGFFSDSAKPIYQIPMVAVGIFLLVLLYFIQLFAPLKSNWMRVAISFFFGGVFANVVDRFNHGYVVDYIKLNFGSFRPTLNFADLIQFLGIGMIFVLQFRKEVFDEDVTKRLWVSKQFQKRYSGQLAIMGICLVGVMGVFSYGFIRVVLQELSVVPTIKAHFLHAYLVFFVAMSITFLLFLYLMGKALSAYVAKPIVDFERYLRGLARGDYGVIKVNEPDFKYLEGLSDEVRDHLVGMHEELRRYEVRKKHKTTAP